MIYVVSAVLTAHVFRLRDRLKMPRVDAAAVFAEMIKHGASCDRADEKLERESMSQRLPAPMTGAAAPGTAVAGPVQPALPWPAPDIVERVDGDILAKIFAVHFVGGHGRPVARVNGNG